jgi:hypothetical protein
MLVIGLHKMRAAVTFHRAARRDVRRPGGGAVYDRALESDVGPVESALTVLRLVIDDVLGALSPGHRSIVELRIAVHELDEVARQVERSNRTVERVLQEVHQRLDARINKGN